MTIIQELIDLVERKMGETRDHESSDGEGIEEARRLHREMAPDLPSLDPPDDTDLVDITEITGEVEEPVVEQPHSVPIEERVNLQLKQKRVVIEKLDEMRVFWTNYAVSRGMSEKHAVETIELALSQPEVGKEFECLRAEIQHGTVLSVVDSTDRISLLVRKFIKRITFSSAYQSKKPKDLLGKDLLGRNIPYEFPYGRGK